MSNNFHSCLFVIIKHNNSLKMHCLLKHYYLLTNLQSNNKNISTKLDFEISKRQDELKKLSRINNNQYLDFTSVLVFLGVN